MPVFAIIGIAATALVIGIAIGVLLGLSFGYRFGAEDREKAIDKEIGLARARARARRDREAFAG